MAQAQLDAILSNPSGCGLGLPIADNTCPSGGAFDEPNRFGIVVSEAPGGALGLDVALREVRLIVSHTWVSDVNIRLVSPTGIVAQLVANVGNREDHFGDPDDPSCTLSARLQIYTCQSIASGIPPFLDGPYRPLEDLWVFNAGNPDPLGLWQLLICDDLPGEAGVLEYVELVFEPIGCLPVQELLVVNQDTTTVTFGYEPSEVCGEAVIEIGPPGFIPGTGATAGVGGTVYTFSGSCPPLVVTGLPEGTFLEAYLRRYCPNTNSYGANSCPVTFRTGCNPGPITAVETFDQQTACATLCNVPCPTLTGSWRNVGGDQMDWISHSGPTPTAVGTGPADDISGGGRYVYLETNGLSCSNGSTAILQSGCFILDKQGTDSCHLSFNYHMWGITTGLLRLQASTDGGFSWTTLWQRSGNQGNQWHKAYLSLSAYPDGIPIQFRFVGTKGGSTYGDIALDQIVVYGSSYQGFPTILYYADLDGDGFGRPGAAVLSCLDTPPLGYAPNNLDCNDNPAAGGAAINPLAAEIPCNGTDENCNAALLNDDVILPPPVVSSDTVCSGQLPTLCAQAAPDAIVLWFSEPTGDASYLDFGDCYSPTLPPNESPLPVVYRFYAEQLGLGCQSVERTEARVVVNPSPRAEPPSPLLLCPGQELDLAAVVVNDAHFTGATVSWHEELPTQPGNLLESTLITPFAPTAPAYRLTSPAGCADEGVLEVGIRPLPEIGFLPADSFSLCRESSGLLTAQVSGGAGGYQYFWENGASSSSRTIVGGSQAGATQAYQLTVTDAQGCVATAAAQVTTTNSIDSLRVFTQAVTNCNGTDGAIRVVPLNGLPPFSFQWASTNGLSGAGQGVTDTIRIHNLTQGAYRITLTDSSGEQCEARIRGIRVQGPGFQVNEHLVQHPACFGGTDGRICLNVTGSANLQYLWSDLSTGPCRENLGAGEYRVTITNGACTTVETFNLEAPDSLHTVLTPIVPSCQASSDGAIAALVFGGVAPYEYLWSNGSAGAVAGSLASGLYTLTVTDAQGCLAFDTLALPAPPVLSLVVDTLIAPRCAGQSNGIVRLGASGGEAPYTWTWSNGATTPLLTGLSAGVYRVTLTDKNNCAHSQDIVVPSPSPVLLAVGTQQSPTCATTPDGQISLVATGGMGPYQFLWNQTPAPAIRTDLTAGVYRIQALDAAGCVSNELTLTLTPAHLITLNVSTTSPLCVGAVNGSINLNAQGSGPFQYAWQDGPTGPNRINLPVGDYPLRITDIEGCVLDTSIQLTAPQVFGFAVTAASPQCAGSADGLINPILLTGGVGAYTYLWNDGSTATTRSGLSPGDYAFQVTDIRGCIYTSDTFTLVDPPLLQFQDIITAGNPCHGDSLGFIDVSMQGGIPPYQYNWVGQGVTQPDISGLQAGLYRLLVEDANGCNKDTTFVINQPNPLVVSAAFMQSGDPCLPGGESRLTAVAQGGSGPYSYLWSNGASQNPLITPPPGDYTAVATDARGCSTESNAVKVRFQAGPVFIDTFFVEPVSCFAGNDASMTVAVSGGSGLYRFHFSSSYLTDTTANNLTVSGLAHSNSYSVTITDLGTGCRTQSEVLQPVQPLPLVITRDSSVDVQCAQGLGGVYVTVQGGTQPYNFLWQDSSGLTVSTAEDLAIGRAGAYVLLVTDARECSAALYDTLVSAGRPPLLVDSLFSVTPPPCRGEATGALQIGLADGYPPFHFRWSNGDTTQNLVNVPGGFYFVTVTDATGCAYPLGPLELPQPASTLIINSQSENISCYGEADGYILLGVLGGGPPYQFAWRRNGQLLPWATGPALSDLFAANYSVRITDSLGCSRQRNFVVTEPDSLRVSILQQSGNGLLALLQGGVGPYHYLWSTGATTQSIDNLDSGEYFVTVTDDNDCEATAEFVLVGASDISQQATNTGPILYPNPHSGEAYLHWPEGLPTGSVEMAVYDLAGRLMQRQQWPYAHTMQALRWPHLSSGHYVLLITTGDGQLYRRQMVLLHP